jgi:hypothetical protein
VSKKEKIEKITTYEEYQQCRAVIRMLVRAREDFQGMRKRMDNRMGRKADGEAQDKENLTARAFSPDDVAAFNEISDESRAMEKDVEKKLERALRRMPIYDWLKAQKGIGTIAMGHICGSFDIFKAETVSKLWQYAGMNPGLVRGKKRKESGDSFEIIQTDDFIRGDKLTAGYVAPFNKTLRTALLGVMGDGFIKSQNKYCMEFYYPMKSRLEREENTVEEISKAGAKPKAIAWKDAKVAHRHRAAIRYMVKMFVADLYAAWRPLHGLSVRKPYQEEYLGHKHKKAA